MEKPADPGKIPDLPKTAEKAPDLAKPDVPAKPDVAVPDAPAPVAPAPVVPKPDAATPDAATPDAAKPEPAKPDAKPAAKGDDPFGSRDVKPLRMWTDASGQYHVEARLVSFQDGTVRLQKANGGYVRIAYDQLCDGDQSFVLRQGRSLFAQE